MINNFLTANTAGMRVARTIFQGIIGVIIANLDYLVDLQSWVPAEYKVFCVALIMAILSPIMAEIGKHTLNSAEDTSLSGAEEVGAVIPEDDSEIK